LGDDSGPWLRCGFFLLTLAIFSTTRLTTIIDDRIDGRSARAPWAMTATCAAVHDHKFAILSRPKILLAATASLRQFPPRAEEAPLLNAEDTPGHLEFQKELSVAAKPPGRTIHTTNRKRTVAHERAARVRRYHRRAFDSTPPATTNRPQRVSCTSSGLNPGNRGMMGRLAQSAGQKNPVFASWCCVPTALITLEYLRWTFPWSSYQPCAPGFGNTVLIDNKNPPRCGLKCLAGIDSVGTFPFPPPEMKPGLYFRGLSVIHALLSPRTPRRAATAACKVSMFGVSIRSLRNLNLFTVPSFSRSDDRIEPYTLSSLLSFLFRSLSRKSDRCQVPRAFRWVFGN